MTTDSSSLQLPPVAPTADPVLEAALRHRMDHKTKPLGALGRLEQLAVQLGLIQRSEHLRLERPQVVVFAADHGIADEGVSAYPQEVTAQMVANMLSGGAAINVLARQHGFAMTVVDAGVASPVLPPAASAAGAPTLVLRKIGFGTRNMARTPAMTGQQALAAVHAGMDVVQHLPGNVVAFGEMGIGNTSSASLLLSRLCGVTLADAVGRGTGLDDARLDHKLRVLFEVSLKHREAKSPLAALTAFGGFEIAMMVGAMLQAASERRVVLVDGFIAGAAALVARGLRPHCTDYMVFAHRSAEAGHRLMTVHLGANPLLNLDMRLGEGSGALVAWPLVQSAALLMNDMASFEGAGVSTAAEPAVTAAQTGRHPLPTGHASA
jgi:nicotinate-nucleotide--dimethylbenzimidazole phosphoribosyltransferase